MNSNTSNDFLGAIVVPCFNEEFRLNEIYWTELINTHPTWLWIFVNDGSADRTIEKLNKLKPHRNVRIFEISENGGKSEAIRFGLLEAIKETPQSKMLGFLDADGAFDKLDVDTFIALSNIRISNENYSALFSSRVALSGRDIQRTWQRHVVGRLVATLIGLRWANAPYDTQSGFKIFQNTHSFSKALAKRFKTKWLIELEILSRYPRHEFDKIQIWEEPLLFWKDIKGSKINLSQSLKIVFELLYILHRLPPSERK
jgi:glycosyltransferase involved in cell wall biosynthesis